MKYKVFEKIRGTKTILKLDNAQFHVRSKTLEFYEKNRFNFLILNLRIFI